MKQIILLLKKINFWTILGAIIAIATAYYTFYAHRDNELDFVAFGPNIERGRLEDGATVRCILVGFNNDSVSNDVSYGLPVGLRNNMKHGIKVEYKALSPMVTLDNPDNAKQLDGLVSTTILQNEGQKFAYHLHPNVEKLRALGSDTTVVTFVWTYEKMSDKGNAKVRFITTRVDEDLINKTDGIDYTVVFVPSSTCPTEYVVGN